jgi:hypothetical protein
MILVLLLGGASGFVLNPPNTSLGTAYRWTVPAAASDNAGLGGGIAWVLEAGSGSGWG